jgi:hypothetical protein
MSPLAQGAVPTSATASDTRAFPPRMQKFSPSANGSGCRDAERHEAGTADWREGVAFTARGVRGWARACGRARSGPARL